MDNTRLNEKAQNVLKRLKDRLCVSPTNKGNIEFIIIDYERLLNENRKMRNRIDRDKLLSVLN